MTEKTGETQRGGKRKGAGRPRVIADGVRVTLWLDKAHKAWLDAQEGNISEVIRGLIDREIDAIMRQTIEPS